MIILYRDVMDRRDFTLSLRASPKGYLIVFLKYFKN